MAKDGTRRGGRRVRAGDKPKALSDKIAEGKDADIMEFMLRNWMQLIWTMPLI